MEFVSGRNIFSKNFSINLCKGRVILEGENICFESPPPPPPPPPRESLTSILFVYCQGYETNIYIFVYQFIGNKKLQGASWVAVRRVRNPLVLSVVILSHKLRSGLAHRTKCLWQDVGKVVLECTPKQFL